MVIITRKWAMANGRTFKIRPVREFVEEAVQEVDVCAGGVIIEPFANASRYGTVTNDLNPVFATDYHMDALEFLKERSEEEADLVLYDPPYSLNQAVQMYKSFGKEKLKPGVGNMVYWAKCKDEVARITKVGGVVLSFGWGTNGMGEMRGFVKEKILIVAHGGSRNDTLCVRERKVEHYQPRGKALKRSGKAGESTNAAAKEQ